MKTYSSLKASQELGISLRAITKRCQRDDIRKKNNRYLIQDKHLEQWRNEIAERNKYLINVASTFTAPVTPQLDLEIESLKKTIADLQNELKSYEIGENERIEVFTDQEYLIFEQRLIEWKTQSQKLIHQEQLFNAEKKSLTEISDHYKHQFEYHKKQANRILEMHQTLLDQIAQQNKLAVQRNIIEAKEKDVINQEWKTK